MPFQCWPCSGHNRKPEAYPPADINAPACVPSAPVPPAHVPSAPPAVQRSLPGTASGSTNYGNHTVSWICPLPLEYAAAKKMLEEEDEGHGFQSAGIACTFGKIGVHNVVMVSLSGMGTVPTANVAGLMREVQKYALYLGCRHRRWHSERKRC
jgi:hypothetical protein